MVIDNKWNFFLKKGNMSKKSWGKKLIKILSQTVLEKKNTLLRNEM